MDANLIVAIAGLLVAAVGSIAVPLYIHHRDSHKHDQHQKDR